MRQRALIRDCGKDGARCAATPTKRSIGYTRAEKKHIQTAPEDLHVTYAHTHNSTAITNDGKLVTVLGCAVLACLLGRAMIPWPAPEILPYPGMFLKPYFAIDPDPSWDEVRTPILYPRARASRNGSRVMAFPIPRCLAFGNVVTF
jgi:hypothetical protein